MSLASRAVRALVSKNNALYTYVTLYKWVNFPRRIFYEAEMNTAVLNAVIK